MFNKNSQRATKKPYLVREQKQNKLNMNETQTTIENFSWIADPHVRIVV